MALDNKLKSEMTDSGTCSSQNSTAPVPNFQNTQSESEPSVQGTRIDDGKVSPKAVPNHSQQFIRSLMTPRKCF